MKITILSIWYFTTNKNMGLMKDGIHSRTWCYYLISRRDKAFTSSSIRREMKIKMRGEDSHLKRRRDVDMMVVKRYKLVGRNHKCPLLQINKIEMEKMRLLKMKGVTKMSNLTQKDTTLQWKNGWCNITIRYLGEEYLISYKL